MKVAFIDRYGANSIWTVLHPIAKQLIIDGHDVVFVKVDDGVQRETIRPPIGVNTYIIKLNTRTGMLSFIFQHLLFMLKFYKFLSETNVDIVHANFIFPSWIARFVTKWFGLVYVNTRHEVFDSMSWHWQLLDKLSVNFVDANIFISDVVATSYKRKISLNKCKAIIKNGINIEELNLIKKSISNVCPSLAVIYPGRFVSVKSQITLINAWPKVLKKFPDARLSLPGAGPDEQKLKQRCNELGISAQVDFPGWLPREETMARIEQSRMIVVPSDGSQEGFGLVVAEAMALGIPLVCSDIPVFREVAGDVANYFPVRNAEYLANLIISNLEHPEIAKTKAAEGVERVNRLFDQRDMVKAYLSLYHQLLEVKR